MCPEVVQATQRIALLHQDIQTSIYDLSHYPEYKEQYQIMSVPCIVIDQQHVLFGKKTMEEMIQVLEKLQSK
ncbi:MAG: thioredoxin family protein, partial [Massilimicrobiota sp.]|nr:thioredoxin family protein [Massilimicrobiota sp.]